MVNIFKKMSINQQNMYGTKKGKSAKGIKLMETQFVGSISNILNIDLHCA